MLMDAPDQIVGHAKMERLVPAAGERINVEGHNCRPLYCQFTVIPGRGPRVRPSAGPRINSAASPEPMNTDHDGRARRLLLQRLKPEFMGSGLGACAPPRNDYKKT